MNENMRLIRQGVSEGLYSAMFLPGQAATKFVALSQKTKAAFLLAIAAIAFMLSPAGSWAASECGGGDAASTITDFIGQAALFLIAVGGAGALLMFAVGALYIIFGTGNNKGKGMDILKNAMIGLVILGVGIFVKYIVLELVEGATGDKSNSSARGCLETGDNAAGG